MKASFKNKLILSDKLRAYVVSELSENTLVFRCDYRAGRITRIACRWHRLTAHRSLQMLFEYPTFRSYRGSSTDFIVHSLSEAFRLCELSVADFWTLDSSIERWSSLHHIDKWFCVNLIIIINYSLKFHQLLFITYLKLLIKYTLMHLICSFVIVSYSLMIIMNLIIN